MPGRHIIFEGPDATGKSTLIRAIQDRLQQHSPQLPVVTTRQPGSTLFGKHIRHLVKHSHSLDQSILLDDDTPSTARFTISPICRQMLYAVDTVDYIQNTLLPHLHQNHTVLVDRTTLISSLIYGQIEKIPFKDLERILSTIEYPPRAARMYVITCDITESLRRKHTRQLDTPLDHFDSQNRSFTESVHLAYEKLITGGTSYQRLLVSKVVPLDEIRYIDNTHGDHSQKIADEILEIID